MKKYPFKDAVNNAKELLNAKIFPETSLYRQAWEQGEIEKKYTHRTIERKRIVQISGFLFATNGNPKRESEEKNINHDLDRIMAKWLATFMDEGLAEWEMPGKKDGFYKAWRKLAIYDSEIGITALREIPKTSSEALAHVLTGYSKEEYTKIFTYHLAALPGWTGYINYRSESNSLWQQEYPISLEDYLGVRLWIAQKLKVQILPDN